MDAINCKIGQTMEDLHLFNSLIGRLFVLCWCLQTSCQTHGHSTTPRQEILSWDAKFVPERKELFGSAMKGGETQRRQSIPKQTSLDSKIVG